MNPLSRSGVTSESDCLDARKDYIRRRLLVDQITSEELRQELRRRHCVPFVITKKQLEYRITKWKFKRNLSPDVWRWVGSQISKRVKQSKTSIVLRSGVELGEQKVVKETSRNPTTILDLVGPNSPVLPPEYDSIIEVRTPPPQDVYNWLVDLELPTNLPWFLFETEQWRFFSGPTISASENVQPVTCTWLASFFRRHGPWALATRISTGTSQDVAKSLIFALSNSLESYELQEQTWQDLVDFLELSGILGTTRDLSRLDDFTLSSFAERLFQHAFVKAAENDDASGKTVVKWMLACRYPPDTCLLQEWETIRPLQLACKKGCKILIEQLLDAKANANLTPNYTGLEGMEGQSPLTLLLHFARDLQRITSTELELVHMLISHGADIEGKGRPGPSERLMDIDGETPLALAAQAGCEPLIMLLLNKGAEMRYRQPPLINWEESYLRVSGRHYYTEMMHMSILTDVLLFNTGPKAASLVLYILHEWHQRHPESRAEEFNTVSDVMAAAMNGTVDVLQIFHRRLGCRMLSLKNEQGLTPLHAAAHKGNLAACKLLVDLGIPIDTLSDEGFSPVYEAYAKGHVEVVKFLFDNGASRDGLKRHLQKQNRSHIEHDESLLLQLGLPFTPGDIPWALEVGLYELALELFDATGDISEATGTVETIWQRLFHESHSLRCSELDRMVDKLLDYDARPVDDAIFHALENRNWHLVTRLLDRGCLWSARRSTTGESTLEVAIHSGDQQFIDSSLELEPNFYEPGALCAAVAFAMEFDDDRLMKRLLENRKREARNERAPDIVEGAALALAIHSMNLQLIVPLLDCLTVIETIPFPPRQTLDELLGMIRIPGSLYSSRHMGDNMDDGMDRWARFWRPSVRRTKSIYKGSPIAFAVYGGDISFVQLLMDRGYVPDQLSLVLAARNNSQAMVELITQYLSQSSAVGAESSDDISVYGRPLFWAVFHGNVAILRTLYDFGEDVRIPFNACSKSFSRPFLQWAVKHEASGMVGFLLEKGVDVNEPPADPIGATSLQLAAIKGNLILAKRLIDLKANINARGAKILGRTALEGAAEHGRIDMIQLLLSEGADTTGRFGRCQYIRAIKFATRGCHHTAAKILQAHREWTDEDHELMKREDLCDECFYDEFPSYSSSLGSSLEQVEEASSLNTPQPEDRNVENSSDEGNGHSLGQAEVDGGYAARSPGGGMACSPNYNDQSSTVFQDVMDVEGNDEVPTGFPDAMDVYSDGIPTTGDPYFDWADGIFDAYPDFSYQLRFLQ